jgi:signal transduction histidine kinase/CheY-like chemotaxis protein
MDRFPDNRLQRMLSYELARRIQYGAAVHLLMIGFFAFGSEEGRARRVQAGGFAALFLLTGTLRMLAARARLRYGERGGAPAGVLRRMYAAHVLHATAWAGFVAYVLYVCFGDPVAEAVMVVCVAGVASSGSSLLAPSRFLATYHVAAQMTAAAVWSLFARAHMGWVVVMVVGCFVLWELFMVRLQHRHTVDTFATRIELEDARDAAEQASSARSRFLATMSHEIRTPLNGLLGLAQILRDDRTLTAGERAEMFDTMIRSGDHLRAIVDDILDFSKVMAGRMELERVPMDLRLLMHDVSQSLAPAARAKGLDVRVHAGASPEWVLGDPVRLRQVVLNLLSNAIKFTFTGGIDMTLGRAPGGEVRIEVRDSGIGIAEENLNLLFQDFQQIDASTRRRFGGTGLGLAIAKHLVERMGGSIAVKSDLGRGASFAIQIPLAAARPSGILDLSVTAPRPAETPAARGAPVRILVAEDNPVNRRIAEVLLRETGAVVEMAENGREAVRMHAADPYRMIFMDGNMPEMDGFEATAAIRAMAGGAGQVPIVALTANALREDRERCLAAGMTDYLAKPVRRDDLHAMVRRYASAGPAKAEDSVPVTAPCDGVHAPP